MSWCPFATKYELQPESDDQPAITPDQFIVHSIAAPWTARRVYEYWRDSTNLESHFAVGYAGDLGQFIGTQTRADANYLANRRPNGHGAVSLESASNLQHTDPWTDAQIDQIVDLGVWLHKEHGIPLRICRSWDDPGYGYHRLYPQWSTNGTACPGDARVSQFRNVIFPRILAGGNGTAPPPVQETDVNITSKNTTNATDYPVVPGAWLPLAFGGGNPAVLLVAGATPVKVLSQSVDLTFAPDDDALVTGVFYLEDADGDTSDYQQIGPRPFGGGHQFVHHSDVPAGMKLKFRVRVDRPSGGTTPLQLLHRSEASRIWSAS